MLPVPTTWSLGWGLSGQPKLRSYKPRTYRPCPRPLVCRWVAGSLSRSTRTSRMPGNVQGVVGGCIPPYATWVSTFQSPPNPHFLVR